jgi:hypothetical protein
MGSPMMALSNSGEQIWANNAQDIFPKQADMKVQVLKLFDIIRKASKLKDLQAEYTKLTGSNFSIRDILRGLHHSKLLRLIREKNVNRGMLWVKTEWIENGQLLGEFKPVGFDLLYKSENIEYE